MGHRGRAPAISGSRRRSRDRWRNRGHERPYSLQREFAERPPALLGWSGSPLPRRPELGKRQPPASSSAAPISGTSTITNATTTAQASSTTPFIRWAVPSPASVSRPAYIPSTLPSNQVANWNNFYTEVLGIVSQPQVLYTRSGTNLALQPLGTDLSDRVTHPLLQRLFQRHLAHAQGLHIDLWPWLSDRDAAHGRRRPAGHAGRSNRKPGGRRRLSERQEWRPR